MTDLFHRGAHGIARRGGDTIVIGGRPGNAARLRAEFRASGLRMMNVYTGPTDDEWHQPLPPPKVAHSALARTIVDGLVEGVEDVWCGDVAQDMAERWNRDAKVLEREMTGGAT